MSVQKIDAAAVSQLLDQLMFLVDGIIETIRSGDDGFLHSAISQRSQISEMIGVFKMEQLEAKTPIKRRDEPSYYTEYVNNLYDRTQEVGAQFTSVENKIIFQGRLWRFLKQQLQQRGDELQDKATEAEVNTAIECWIINSYHKDTFYSDQFFYTGLRVLEDFTRNVMDQRKKNPQKKLFDNG